MSKIYPVKLVQSTEITKNASCSGTLQAMSKLLIRDYLLRNFLIFVCS